MAMYYVVKWIIEAGDFLINMLRLRIGVRRQWHLEIP